MGLAPSGVSRVLPHPPLELEDPSLKPTPLPSPPSPSLFPPPLLALFATLREGAAQAGGGEGSWGEGGWRGGGGPSKRHLGLDPHLGALDFSSQKGCRTSSCLWREPRYTGGCRSDSVSCRAAVGHLACWERKRNPQP